MINDYLKIVSAKHSIQIDNKPRPKSTKTNFANEESVSKNSKIHFFDKSATNAYNVDITNIITNNTKLFTLSEIVHKNTPKNLDRVLSINDSEESIDNFMNIEEKNLENKFKAQFQDYYDYDMFE